MNLSIEFWLQIAVYLVTIAAGGGSLLTRLRYIEKKLDKHNQLVERMVVVEQSTKSAHKRIDELKEGKT